MRIVKNIIISLFVLTCSISFVGQAVNGDIELYMDNIIDNVPGNSGNNYSDPNIDELNDWNAVINFLLVNNLSSARSTASGLNYKVTEFTDTSISPNQVFYVLEKENSSSNYWGTYVFSKTPVRNNLIIQAPHIKNDTNTGQQAVYCFKNTLARAVFISGTHRCNSSVFSSCSGSTSTCNSSSQSFRVSDMSHNVMTMFQKTTENLKNSISNSVFIQLHGFGKKNTDPYVIMSNGTRQTPTTDYATLIKNELLIEDNTLTFKLAHTDTSWTRLIGFTNTQGRLVNSSSNHCNTSATTTTGRFIHIEQEKSKLRNNSTGWNKMSNALKNVFSNTLYVEDTSLNTRIFVSPNPTSGSIVIYGKEINQIKIYNVQGQLIRSEKNNRMENLFIDLRKESKGVYFLKIKVKGDFILKKIIRL